MHITAAEHELGFAGAHAGRCNQVTSRQVTFALQVHNSKTNFIWQSLNKQHRFGENATFVKLRSFLAVQTLLGPQTASAISTIYQSPNYAW